MHQHEVLHSRIACCCGYVGHRVVVLFVGMEDMGVGATAERTAYEPVGTRYIGGIVLCERFIAQKA